MSTYLVRSAVVEQLGVLFASVTWPSLAEHPDGPTDLTLQVSTARPREWYFYEQIDGSLDIPSMRGRNLGHSTEDEFEIKWDAQTAVPGRNALQAMQRIEAIANAALTAIGTTSLPVVGLHSLTWKGSCVGPAPFELEDGPSHGWGARISLTLSCASRTNP